MPSLGWATVLSAVSMLVSFAFIPLKLVSEPLADATSIFLSVGAMGGVLLVGSLMLAWESPVATSEANAARGERT